jgi:transcriptional regulator with XRE-family HTH domain
MRSEVAKRMMAKMPEETKIFVRKYADLVVLINQILREKGINQKGLADILGKQPSEIHKWLSGEHNFTLKSLCKLEAELGHELLVVPVKKPSQQFEKAKQVGHFKVYTNVAKNLPSAKEWTEVSTIENSLADVG